MTPTEKAREIVVQHLARDAPDEHLQSDIAAALAEAVKEKDAEIERLKAALTKIADLDVDYPRAHIYRNDGLMSKFDKCPHDHLMYEGCDACVADFARAALSKARGETT